MPALFIAAETLQSDLYFENIGRLARVNDQGELLTDSKVEGGEPDHRPQGALAAGRGCFQSPGGELADVPVAVDFEELREVGERAVGGGLVDGEGEDGEDLAIPRLR